MYVVLVPHGIHGFCFETLTIVHIAINSVIFQSFWNDCEILDCENTMHNALMQ